MTNRPYEARLIYRSGRIYARLFDIMNKSGYERKICMIIDVLTEKVAAAFAGAGYEVTASVSLSDRPDLCQFQSNNAFAAAKAYHKAPFIVADEVAAILSKDPMFAEVQGVKPGFVNITLTDEAIAAFADELSADPAKGVPADGGETIVMDYGGPNVAKPLHIGHLRSAIIGQSLKLIARRMGNKVYSDIHLGDWGLQIGLVIAELSERMPQYTCFGEYHEGDELPALTADMLNEVYPAASARSKTDEAFAAKAHAATADLQDRRPGYIALWKEIMRVSCADLRANYDALGVDFDYWYGESDADAYIPELMDILESKGLAYESEGAIVVDVAEESDKAPIPPVIVRKSDGSSIYATTDLAALIQRMRDFSPDKVWYVVDNRQEQHFTQVFRCARKAGIVPESTATEFLGFGTMNGTDGKPYKTREGGVMRLSDMISQVVTAARERMDEQGRAAEADRDETARRIGMAAIKFGDLINHRAKDYIFDIDKFLSAEGKTGVYILYTVSRINSILRRAAENSASASGKLTVTSDSERALMLALITSGRAWELAFSERAPSYICEDVYQLAAAFSRFYHDVRILDEEDPAVRASRLAMCSLTRDIITDHLDALGIKTVEMM